MNFASIFGIFLFIVLGNGMVLHDLNEAESKALVKKLEAEFIAEKDETSGDSSYAKKIHQLFFDKLTEQEQEWVLRLAIAHEGEPLGSKLPNDPKLPGVNRISSDAFFSFIPESVMEMMLNGEISKTFQRKLVKWLRKDLGYTDADFNAFRLKNSEFCKGPENSKSSQCMSLTNIGSLCCPFG